MSIPTPVTSEKIDETSQIQKKLIRDSLGIHDFPIQPEKTYIVFDAVAGANDLHLIVGASSTYSILKGDGEPVLNYTDTGGTKTLTYVNAGRYLITIVGNFNGIDTNGKTQVEKDKYISVIGGSNYLPTTLTINAFQDCTKLEFFEVQSITVISANAFDGCVLIESIYYPNSTDIGANAFDGCTKLKILKIKTNTTLGTDAFKDVIIVDVFMIGIESLPKFKDQYVSIAGGFYAENARIILDANFNNIRITPDLINGVPAIIKMIQYVFQNIDTGDVINSSDTVAVNTGLEVAITPITATSKLIVSFHSDWEFVISQSGVTIEYEYTDDNYVTSTIKTATLITGNTTILRRTEVTGKIEIPNTGIVNEIKCRIIFKARTDTFNATFYGTRGAFMDVSEMVI